MTKSTKVLSVLVSSFFVMTIFAPSAFALTWNEYADPGAYIIDDLVVDSSGDLHAVANHYSGASVDAIAYGYYDGSNWSWTDIRTTIGAGQDPYSRIRLDFSGNPGIITELSDSSGADESEFYFHNPTELGNWTTSADATTSTDSNRGPGQFSWDFDANDNPRLAVCGEYSSTEGLYEFTWNEVGQDFNSESAIDTSLECSYVDFRHVASNEYWVVYRSYEVGTESVYAKFYSSSWGVTTTPLTGLDHDTSGAGIGMELNSLGRPQVYALDDSSTANSDAIRFASWNGASWDTSDVVTGIELDGGYGHEGIDLKSDDSYVTYYKANSATSTNLMVANNNGGSWSDEIVSTLSDASLSVSGLLAPITYDSNNDWFFIAAMMYRSNYTSENFVTYSGPALSSVVPEFSDAVYILSLLLAFTAGYFAIKPRLGHEIVKK